MGWPHKKAIFSLFLGTFWQGIASGGDRASQLCEHCPTPSPFGEQRASFRERPTSPFPPGTIWSLVLRARDTADAEQCSPAFGLQSQPSACQQGRHYPALKLIFYFSRGISSLPLYQQLLLHSSSVCALKETFNADAAACWCCRLQLLPPTRTSTRAGPVLCSLPGFGSILHSMMQISRQSRADEELLESPEWLWQGAVHNPSSTSITTPRALELFGRGERLAHVMLLSCQSQELVTSIPAPQNPFHCETAGLTNGSTVVFASAAGHGCTEQ